MVACLEDLAHLGEEALHVRCQQLLLMRPEEAHHRRAGEVERAVALAVDALPRLRLCRFSRPRRLSAEERSPATIGAIAHRLSGEESVSVWQAECDRLDGGGPAHLLVELEAIDLAIALERRGQPRDV